MLTPDMLSINNVAAKLGLSVHQLRRWELMFGLEIKRGRGQQRQYREEDMSVLERIKELVEQGWPTAQIRPQLEAEGLLTPKLIGVTPAPGNPEVLQEAIIGLRSFTERRFIDISRQIDELRQLIISTTLKQELSADRTSPWQPMASEFVPAPVDVPEQEITIGPQISIDPPKTPAAPPPVRTSQIPPAPSTAASTSASPTAYGSQTGLTGNSDPSRSNFSPTDSRSSMPAVDSAPKPITDALQRSMSTLDSLFKDPRAASSSATSSSTSTPAVGASSSPAVGTGSSTQHPAIASGFESDPVVAPAPVRHSTIPPTPTASPATPSVTPEAASAQAPETTISSPAKTDQSTSSGSYPFAATSIDTPAVGTTSSTSSSTVNPTASPASTTSTTSAPAIKPVIPSNPSSSAAAGASASAFPGTVSRPPSVPLPMPGSSPSASAKPAESASAAIKPVESAAAAKPSAWDQAFASTSVDINAVPASGLYDDSKPQGTASGTNSGINPASLEHNPFTTITGTNYNAVGGSSSDSQSSGLLGQTAPSGTGFGGSPGMAANIGMTQTGPMPAHMPIESFAPEAKDKMLEAQSKTTSSELPQADKAIPPTSASAPPALPITPGPQVNFGPSVQAPTPQVTPQRLDDNFGLGEVTDQNYLTVLGRALDLIGWSDEQADSYSLKTFGVPHWDELGRSQAEKLVAHLVGLLKDQLGQ